ncbi:biotin--[acetyl-CoA carboxylase] ligase [Sphingomonas changbaiensis NBRC 104936]|uniref:biotin--[biotin carboxyl-carrier protein] ligase n=1 Tax=Sphingomonas changbaiensis NBRC 104936 TaxID=1219043 RepID=A0A0E9MN54_9SPHN|nr:biotin--[acetyl-CoA-carboxylase] ligase [Sphingomonas changbaiensis]GAO38959.1 biotin--[acetyl-CoA carboxylase] ligase [Sphingomonas changbaiensis NBRC 104936]
MIDIRTVPSTASTNADMLALAAAGAAEGLWLRAVEQTAGRGRQGRAWSSPPGNLYASTIVRLRPGDPNPATLAMVAAVALDEVLRAYGAEPIIKWPNDLLIGDAKLTGILLERSGDGVVVGIGVNLAHHPEGLDRAVTSVAAQGLGAPDPELFLRDLAEAFARWLAQWRAGLEPVRRRWLERAHTPGTALSVRLPDQDALDGLFDGLDGDGALRLRLASGEVQVIHAGDVFLI